MSDKIYDQRDSLLRPGLCANCSQSYELHSVYGPAKCPHGKGMWFPAKVAEAIKKIASDRTDSIDKDAQISEQIRVNKELREQIAKAAAALDTVLLHLDALVAPK